MTEGRNTHNDGPDNEESSSPSNQASLNGHENIDPNIFFKIKTGKITIIVVRRPSG